MSELFAGPIAAGYALVTGLIQILSPFAGAAAGAIAIVLFTAAVRLLLSPLSYFALRGQAAQARLLPQIEELRRKHARRPDLLRQEIADLTQREGGPLAGCLPLLLQLPFFSVMYRLFISAQVGGHPNDLLGQRLLGVPLGAHWLGGTGVLSGQGAVFAGVFALIALVGWFSARVARRFAVPPPPVAGDRPGRARTAGPAAGAGAAPGAGAAGALAKAAPYATVLFAMFVPLAAGLYLLTSAAWSVAERRLLLSRGRGSGT
jgi:YidC/Oxa1 family membrane protein insertase